MSLQNMLRVTTIPASKHCTGSVIFLHGSGGNGLMTKHDIEFHLKEKFMFPHLKVRYPSAPLRPFTLNGGLPQNVWFDRLSLQSNSPEHLESIDSMAAIFDKLIEEEISSGIPPNRIILGGFSQGGCFALHYGYRHRRDLKGIFCLSSYLSEESKVYQELNTSTGPLPPLFMACGVKDDVIEYKWAENTDKKLKSSNVETIFHRYENLYHEHCNEELTLLKEWIIKLLPPL